MASSIYTDPARRHDFVLLFDVADGNPNGDPDAGNLPRVDPETMQGLVTDVAIKRKVRNYVQATHGAEPGYDIYVQHHGVLNTQHRRAYADIGERPVGPAPTQAQRGTVDRAQARMCALFYDIRLFGAVMTTQVNAGQVRGPVQLTFARSIDPVTPLDLAITRVAVTQEEQQATRGRSAARRPAASEDDAGEEEERGKLTEMGRKPLVPYGLYRAYGFFNPFLAQDTGANEKDLSIVWEALERMWDLDRSASRGLMACRGIYVFSHENSLGNAPAHKLFEWVQVQRKAGVEAPRQFTDYVVTVNDTALPKGITLTRLGV